MTNGKHLNKFVEEVCLVSQVSLERLSFPAPRQFVQDWSCSFVLRVIGRCWIPSVISLPFLTDFMLPGAHFAAKHQDAKADSGEQDIKLLKRMRPVLKSLTLPQISQESTGRAIAEMMLEPRVFPRKQHSMESVTCCWFQLQAHI